MYSIDQRKERAAIILQKLRELYPQMPKVPLNYTNEWEFLVAVVLSAQCTDKKVNKVTQVLFKKYPSFDDYLNADISTFEQDIRSTGFYKNKARNVLEAARILDRDYARVIPNTMEALVALPGVGRKTANVVMGILYNKVEGVVVDTHIKRLATKFGLTTNTSPEKIEKDLMLLIDKDDWWAFANKLKCYGQDYSPAHKKFDESDPISQVLKVEGLL